MHKIKWFEFKTFIASKK